MLGVCNLIHLISQKFNTRDRNIRTKTHNYPLAEHKVFINMMIFFSSQASVSAEIFETADPRWVPFENPL